LDEGHCIQQHLRFGGTFDKDKAARIFNHLMLQGKVHAALCYLFCHSSGGVLNLDALVPEKLPNGNEVISPTHRILLDKHPLGKPPDPSALLSDPLGVANPVIFEGLETDAIQAASLHTAGAAGPSGLDANVWHCLCCCYKSASVVWILSWLLWDVEFALSLASGSLQVCAGHEGGCEAAVHAVRHLFQDPGSHTILLVDASNAFNSVNRQAALQNIH